MSGLYDALTTKLASGILTLLLWQRDGCWPGLVFATTGRFGRSALLNGSFTVSAYEGPAV